MWVYLATSNSLGKMHTSSTGFRLKYVDVTCNQPNQKACHVLRLLLGVARSWLRLLLQDGVCVAASPDELLLLTLSTSPAAEG